jgi:hypothetical protein
MKAELVLGNLKRERDALEGKLERLHTALCKEWKDEDQEYLCTQQYNAMSLYAHILDERIADVECKLALKKSQIKDGLEHEKCHSDKSIFKENVDLGSYKDCAKNTCKEEEQSCEEDVEDIFIDLIEDVFGVKINR